MTKGKATGTAREYQEHCRDILIHRDLELEPYSGDGIDVPFAMGGTTWSIDVVLRHKTSGSVVIAECRRRQDAVQQNDVGAFAYEAELLREQLGVPVAALFVAKKAIQIGALKTGDFNGISMVVVDEDAVPPSFKMDFHRFDANRKKRYHEYVLHIAPASLSFKGELAMVLIKKDK